MYPGVYRWGTAIPGTSRPSGRRIETAPVAALVTVLRGEHDHARLVEGVADLVASPDGTEERLIDDDRRVPPPEVERQRLADGIDRGGGADLPLARARGLDVVRPRHPAHGDLVREREGGRDRRAGVRRDLVDGLADRVVGVGSRSRRPGRRAPRSRPLGWPRCRAPAPPPPPRGRRRPPRPTRPRRCGPDGERGCGPRGAGTRAGGWPAARAGRRPPARSRRHRAARPPRRRWPRRPRGPRTSRSGCRARR